MVLVGVLGIAFASLPSSPPPLSLSLSLSLSPSKVCYQVVIHEEGESSAQDSRDTATVSPVSLSSGNALAVDAVSDQGVSGQNRSGGTFLLRVVFHILLTWVLKCYSVPLFLHIHRQGLGHHCPFLFLPTLLLPHHTHTLF